MSNDTTSLPEGYRILNDGPGREVLVNDAQWEYGYVFPTVQEAIDYAWQLVLS